MNEAEDDTMTSISKAHTLEEIAEYWDTHSLTEHWDERNRVEFEVRFPRRRRVALDPDVYTEIAAQAQRRGVLPERLRQPLADEPAPLDSPAVGLEQPVLEESHV